MDRVGRTRAAATVVMAMALVTLSAMGALAQDEYPPPEDFGLVCMPSNPEAGTDVSCEVSGAQPGEQLQANATLADAANGSLLDTQLTADEAGRAGFGFSVPGDAADGSTIDVVVNGDESGQVATQLTVSNVVEVEGEVITRDDVADPDEVAADVEVEGVALALTGAQIVSLVAVGSLLLAAGLVLVRRRRVAKVAS